LNGLQGRRIEVTKKVAYPGSEEGGRTFNGPRTVSCFTPGEGNLTHVLSDATQNVRRRARSGVHIMQGVQI